MKQSIKNELLAEAAFSIIGDFTIKVCIISFAMLLLSTIFWPGA